MEQIQERKRYELSEDSSSSEDSKYVDRYQHTNDELKKQTYVIHPPISTREKYESSDSERSKSDFADLCEDKPKKKIFKEEELLVTKNYNDFSRKNITSDASIRNTESIRANSSRSRKFTITFGSKTNHQWAKYNQSNKSISINGRNGPVLHLYRGNTYYFCIEEGDDTFFLTDSPAGGFGSKPISGGFAPLSKGCVCFKVDKHTPRYFYYQSSINMFGGGLIIVHDV